MHTLFIHNGLLFTPRCKRGRPAGLLTSQAPIHARLQLLSHGEEGNPTHDECGPHRPSSEGTFRSHARQRMVHA